MFEMSDVSGNMLSFGFTFGSNFTFLSLKLVITQTKENKTPFTLASHADVLLARHAILRGAGTRDEPLRTSTWEVTSTRILFASKKFRIFFTNLPTIFD